MSTERDERWPTTEAIWTFGRSFFRTSGMAASRNSPREKNIYRRLNKKEQTCCFCISIPLLFIYLFFVSVAASLFLFLGDFRFVFPLPIFSQLVFSLILFTDFDLLIRLAAAFISLEFLFFYFPLLANSRFNNQL